MADSVVNTQSADAGKEDGAAQELVVRCLMMPFHGFNALMPNTAVAEVVAYEEPRSGDQGPAWLKGFFAWRGIAVPVISLERIVGARDGVITSHARLVIFNTLSDDAKLPFIAMVAEGIPRLVALKGDSLHYAPGHSDEETGVYARLLVDGNAVVVPDLEVIEKMVMQVRLRHSK